MALPILGGKFDFMPDVFVSFIFVIVLYVNAYLLKHFVYVIRAADPALSPPPPCQGDEGKLFRRSIAAP